MPEQKVLLPTKSKIEVEVDKAINFFSPKFDIEKPKNFEVLVINLPETKYATSEYERKTSKGILKFDIKKILTKAQAMGMENIKPHLDFLVGEEVGHFLHFYINPDLTLIRVLPEESKALVFMQDLVFIETIGSYAGLIYLNRNQNKTQKIWTLPDLGFNEGWVNEAADTLFSKYGDTKLLYLASIKNRGDAVNQIRELEK